MSTCQCEGCLHYAAQGCSCAPGVECAACRRHGGTRKRYHLPKGALTGRWKSVDCVSVDCVTELAKREAAYAAAVEEVTRLCALREALLDVDTRRAMHRPIKIAHNRVRRLRHSIENWRSRMGKAAFAALP